MVSLTTQEVTVSAESVYQQQYSVIDATGARRLVEGEGVVGQQPDIMPGQYHEYTSWVQFETPIGAMRGSYVMQRTDRYGRGDLFQVEVPKFLHMAPEVLN